MSYVIEDIKRMADERGWKCLSNSICDMRKAKLDFQCPKDHFVQKTAHSFIYTATSTKGCSICSQRVKFTTEMMHEIARSRLGEFLSEVYINKKTPHLWRCKCGNEWYARPDDVIRGNWCKICRLKEGAAKRKGTIEGMQRLARKHSGECLSNDYIDTKTKLVWKCRRYHEFLMTPGDVTQGHWCSKCAGTAKGTLAEMQEFAKKRGGQCISNQYINNRTHLEFSCSEGHQWKATPKNIRGSANNLGSWCPNCNNTSTVEEITRYIFEAATSKNFPKRRDVLSGLELDGYCESLKLAFEFQGLQHKEYNDFYHAGDVQNFLLQQQRDETKRINCSDMGITLLEIHDKKKGFNELKNLIESKLFESNIPIVCEKSCIELDEFYKSKSIINELQAIAASRGGKLISTAYYNAKTPLEWECKLEHRWFATSSTIKNHWCNECAKKNNGAWRKLTLADVQHAALKRGGRVISTTYINSQTKLEFECHLKHRWHARPNDIVGGKSWCPDCKTLNHIERIKAQQPTITDMQQLAALKRGKCLSLEYLGTDTKLEWECRLNHLFGMTPHDVKGNHWCPTCSNRKKHTIEDMKAYAEEKGGKCLSNSYTNNKGPLKWQCHARHIWTANANSILSKKTWCPECYQENRTKNE